MGLGQAQAIHRFRALLAQWSLPLAIAAIAALIMLLGEAGRVALRYDSDLSGEAYRLISGHFVHLGRSHLLLNLAGLLLVWYLVGAVYSPIVWSLVLLASIAAIDLGFWQLLPGLEWYVGLSGVLHGVLVAGVVGLWRIRRMEAVVLMIVVAAKLAYEALIGPLPGSESGSGGTVITEAHLFGAIGGALAAIVVGNRVRPEASI